VLQAVFKNETGHNSGSPRSRVTFFPICSRWSKDRRDSANGLGLWDGHSGNHQWDSQGCQSHLHHGRSRCNCVARSTLTLHRSLLRTHISPFDCTIISDDGEGQGQNASLAHSATRGRYAPALETWDQPTSFSTLPFPHAAVPWVEEFTKLETSFRVPTANEYLAGRAPGAFVRFHVFVHISILKSVVLDGLTGTFVPKLPRVDRSALLRICVCPLAHV
jgi:hypothetical protein